MKAARRGPDESAADAEAFGLTLGTEVEAFEIWPENLESLELFLGLATQWRVDGMSGATLGLDYTAVESYLRMHDVADPRATFADIQLMELAALGELNSQREAARG